MAGASPVTVTDSLEHERYEAQVDGDSAGYLTYRRLPDRTVLLHTKVDPRFEGMGVGSALARGALDDERARGHHVEPRCPFVSAFINRHPEYGDLVPEEYQGLLER